MGSTIPKTFIHQSSSLAGQAVTRGVVCHDVRVSNRSALPPTPAVWSSLYLHPIPQHKGGATCAAAACCKRLSCMHTCRPSCYYDVEEAHRRDQCSSLTAMPVAGAKGEILGAVCLGLQQNVNLSSKWVPPFTCPVERCPPRQCLSLEIHADNVRCAVYRQAKHVGAIFVHLYT